MTTDNLRNYFKKQQGSLQWMAVLGAMSAELSSVSETEDLRDLFFRIGERFASGVDVDFDSVQSLTELEGLLNDFWAEHNWGWVSLVETQGYIDITHQCAPLAQAFGDDSLPWSVGLLAGFYQTMFNGLGASEGMSVRSEGESTDGMDIYLRFGL